MHAFFCCRAHDSDDEDSGDEMFESGSLFSKMFAADPKKNRRPNAESAIPVSQQPIKVEAEETQVMNDRIDIMNGVVGENASRYADRDSDVQTEENQSNASVPAFLPFFLGEMLQTEAPAPAPPARAAPKFVRAQKILACLLFPFAYALIRLIVDPDNKKPQKVKIFRSQRCADAI